jgi:hypothetical protein
LQQDIDDWVDSYNCTRPHSRRYCYGKTPMQTFLDSKQIVQQKMLERQYEDRIGDEVKNKKEHGEDRETNQTQLTPIVSVWSLPSVRLNLIYYTLLAQLNQPTMRQNKPCVRQAVLRRKIVLVLKAKPGVCLSQGCSR